MTSHYETQILPYTPQQMFDLVADVERYPLFLPWCKAARISEKTPDSFLGELVIHYKGLRESYSSRVYLTPHRSIEVVMERGPFEHLTNHWRFTERSGGTQVDFNIDFAFRSRMLDKMMGGFFLQAAEKMMGAFCARAAELYGHL